MIRRGHSAYQRRVIKTGAAIALLGASLLLAAGCTAAVPAPRHAKNAFTSRSYGIAIAYPADFSASRSFPRNYLSNGAWEVYAGPQSRGRPIVALVLAGSNSVTDAELRIGASRDPQAVQRCTRPPAALRPGSLGHAKLDGVDFTTFEASDAAMSHYLLAHSYRAVHDGTCYAIDLIIFGTNPAVYDPPRKPPFSHAQAFARLQEALRGFRFMRD